MSYPSIKVLNKVFEQGEHYLTADYKTRNPSYPTHKGMDMIGKGRAADNIVAIAAGKVIAVGSNSSAGNYVRLSHGSGIETVYYHMRTDTIKVKQGQNVSKHQVLGYMGSTGNSTGPHLHFGVYLNDSVVDPLPYLNGSKTIGAGGSGTGEQFKGKVYFYNGSPDVGNGSSGWDVQLLQAFLRRKGLYSGKIDGIAGVLTEAAIKSYQKGRSGVLADGKAGRRTFAFVAAELAAQAFTAGGSATITYYDGKPDVGSGAEGWTVQLLQAFLAGHGLYSGKIDGIAGGLTEAAIKTYQQHHSDVFSDGKAGRRTFAHAAADIVG